MHPAPRRRGTQRRRCDERLVRRIIQGARPIRRPAAADRARHGAEVCSVPYQVDLIREKFRPLGVHAYRHIQKLASILGGELHACSVSKIDVTQRGGEISSNIDRRRHKRARRDGASGTHRRSCDRNHLPMVGRKPGSDATCMPRFNEVVNGTEDTTIHRPQ